MKLKICLIKSDYGSLHIIQESELNYWVSTGGYQFSDIIEVDFNTLDKKDEILKQVAQIDSLMEKTAQKYTIELNELKQKKNELLALEYIPEWLNF